MENCVFCKIRDGVINSTRYYEDEYFFIIADVNPKAKKHYLAIPKNHYAYLSEQTEQDNNVIAHILKTIPTLAEKLGIYGGYRLIINQGENGGQEVPHLHIHILGGEKLSQ